MSLQRLQVSLLCEQLQGHHSQSYPPSGVKSSDLMGQAFAEQQQSDQGLGISGGAALQPDVGLMAGGQQGQTLSTGGLNLSQQQMMQNVAAPGLGQEMGNVGMAGVPPPGITLNQLPQDFTQPPLTVQQMVTATPNPYGAVGHHCSSSQDTSTTSDVATAGSLETPMNISRGNIWSFGSADQPESRGGNF